MAPRIDSPVYLTVIIPRELREAIQAAADANGGQSLSSWVRMALAAGCRNQQASLIRMAKAEAYRQQAKSKPPMS